MTRPPSSRARQGPIGDPRPAALAELAALRDENAALRALLADRTIAFPHAWRLTKKESELLRLLLKRDLVTPEAAMTVLYGARPGDPPGSKIISVFIHHIRRKLAPCGVSVQTRQGQGYRLGPETKARVRAFCGAGEGGAS